MQPLFITHKYPPSIGGMEKQSYELIERMGYKYNVRKIAYDGSMGRLKFFLSVIPEVKKILRENPGISFIHLNDGLMAMLGLIIKRITKVPIFVTLHGLDLVFPNKFYQKFIVRNFKKFDGIIPVSRATASECIKRGINFNKIFIVNNGVDHRLGEVNKQSGFRQNLEKLLGISLEGKNILVSIGRAVPRKGFSWFIENVISKLNKDIVYLIIGANNNRNAGLEKLIKYLPGSIAHQIALLFAVESDKTKIFETIKNKKLEQRVFYLGQQDRDTIIQILHHSDIFIMPNIKIDGDAEGFGLVALEASICGLPVLASNIEGITSAVIDGKNGFLIQPGDPSLWISFIKSALSNPKSLRKFGRKAKEYTIQNYSWDKMVEEYISVFLKVIKNTEVEDENERMNDPLIFVKAAD